MLDWTTDFDQRRGNMEDGNLKIFACNLRRALRAPEECDIPWMLETAARELDRLRIVAGAADELERLREEAAERELILAGCEAMICDLRSEVERLNRRVADQIRWANDRACEAEESGDKSGEEAWYGYVNALRWIQTLLPAEPSGSRAI
jgi:hypothetical protein